MTTQSPTFAAPLRIGARGSKLALAQAHEARDRLIAAHGWAEAAVEIAVIKTLGDRIVDRPLSEVGGKGLFTKEIEEALLDRRIDVAVHSMKDMPTVLPDGLVVAALLPREDVRDAFVSRKYRAPADLPQGAVVGTSSLRRQAQILNRRPDLKIVGFRGNVQTRLGKLDAGQVDATFLACAGLKRLGMEAQIASAIEVEEMLPAVAQGAIGVECREDDAATRALLGPIDHHQTGLRLSAERAFLGALDGSCRTPIGGLAMLQGDDLWFRGEIVRPDGSERLAAERRGPAADGAALGLDAARELRGRGGDRFFTE